MGKTDEESRMGSRLAKVSAQEQKRENWVFYPLLIIFSFAFFICLYFATPLSKLNQVTFKPDASLKKSAIATKIPYQKNDSVLAVLKSEKRAKRFMMEQNPHIETVRFHFQSPMSLEVQAKGVVNPMYIKRGDKLFPVFNDGHIGKKAVLVPDKNNICVIEGFNSKSEIENLVRIYKKIPQKTMINIKRIKWVPGNGDNQRVELIMKDGNQLYFRLGSLLYKISFYPKIEKGLKNPSVVNMEVGAYSYPLR